MAKDGCCDIPSLIVTEINFTPRILKDLENTKYYNKDYKAGDKIPDELMDNMFRDDKSDMVFSSSLPS